MADLVQCTNAGLKNVSMEVNYWIISIWSCHQGGPFVAGTTEKGLLGGWAGEVMAAYWMAM